MKSNLKSFKSFTNDRIKSVVVTFGRFQPFTIGHEKLFNTVASLANGNNYRIYTSQTQDKSKNPLKYSDKIKFLRKAFSKYGRNIIEDKSVRNVFDVFVSMYEQGFTRITLVVGSDRIAEFSKTLLKYNGVKSSHGYYHFPDGIYIESSGDRDPDAEGVVGMSASKMRAAVAENDYDSFSKGLPKDFKEGIDLFKALRVGMGLRESVIYRKHIKLKSISEHREKYVKGELISIGESVKIKGMRGSYIIKELGPNYVSIDVDGVNKKKWIHDIEKE